MKKRRFLAALLSVLMIFGSIPFDTINVKAAMEGSGGLVYTYDDSDHTATVTGYEGNNKTTVSSIIVPATVQKDSTSYSVTKINKDALNITDMPKLSEVAVLSDTTVLEDGSILTPKGATTSSDKYVVWCNNDTNSLAYKYADAFGMTKKFLNTKDIVIKNYAQYYFTGCVPVEVKALIDEGSEDIIWETSDSTKAWFDEDGKEVTTTSGTFSTEALDTDPNTKTGASSVRICITKENANKGNVTITARSKGTGKEASFTFAIKTSTQKIEPKITIYKPVLDSSGKPEVVDAKQETDGITRGGIKLERISDVENYGFDIANSKLYVDTGCYFLVNGGFEDDIDDWMRVVTQTSNVCYYDFQDANYNINVDTTDYGQVLINDAKDAQGNQIDTGSKNNRLFYAAAPTGTPEQENPSSLTITSQNNVKTQEIKVNVLQPATDLKTLIGESVIEDNFQGLELSTYDLNHILEPSNSTDNVKWQLLTNSTQNGSELVDKDGVCQINNNNSITLNTAGTSTLVCTIVSSQYYERTLKKTITIHSIKRVNYTEIAFTNQTKDTIITEDTIPTNQSYQLYIGDSKDGKLIMAASGEAANEPVRYTSANEAIASVSADGVVKTTAKPGDVEITATAESGVTKKITLHVYAPVEKIVFDTNGISIPEGQTRDFPYSFQPDGSSEDVIWTSGNTSVFTAVDYTDESGKRYVRVTGLKASDPVNLTGTTKLGKKEGRVQVKVDAAVHADTLAINAGPEGTVKQYKDTDGSIVFEVPRDSTFYLNPSVLSNSGATVNDQLSWFIEAGQTNLSINTSGNGLAITANSIGKTEISLTAKGGSASKTTKCYINVVVPANKIDILANGYSSDMVNTEINDDTTKLSLMCSSDPYDTTDSITWSVDDESIASLSKNITKPSDPVIITPKKIGTVKITAKAEHGATDIITVNVIKSFSSLKLVCNNKEVTEGYVIYGGESQFNLKVLDEDTTDTKFTWGIQSDTGIIQIDSSADGMSAKIKGLATGAQYITVTADSSRKQQTFLINVVRAAESITLNNTAMSVFKGDSIKAFATLSPDNTTDVVSWETDKDGIVSIINDPEKPSTNNVKNIIITGVEDGTVKVTARTVSGKTAEMTITINSIPINDITINDLNDQVYTGSEINPTFTISKGDKILTKDIDYTYTLSNNIESGKGIINITGIGNYSGNNSFEFNINKLSMNYVYNEAVKEYIYNGNDIVPDIELYIIKPDQTKKILEKDKDYTLKYVDDGKSAGTKRVEVTGIGNFTDQRTIEYTVNPKSITSSDITVADISSYTYSCKAIEPKVSIKDGDTPLVLNQDYTLGFSNNVDCGTATVTIYGCNNYKDTIEKTFTINKRKLAGTKFQKIDTQYYTGKSIIPYISATLRNMALNEGTDYKIKFSNNKYPGRATVTLTGIGNYTSSVSTTFIILPLATKAVKVKSKTVSSVTLSWSAVKGAKGYSIYLYNEKKGKYIKAASASKNAITIKKLSSGTNYTYMVCSNVKVGSKTYTNTAGTCISTGTLPATPKIKSLKSLYGGAGLKFANVRGAEGYQVYCATSKKGKYKLYATVSGSTDISGLRSRKTCYFKMRAYRTIDGKVCYSAFSSVKAVRVK